MTKEEKDKPDGWINWFKILYKTSDEDMKIISGTDGALYVMFLRFVSLLFLVLTVVNCIFIIPIYISGDPSPKQLAALYQQNQTYYDLYKVTVINISDNGTKVAGTFSLIVLLTSTMSFFFTFLYWKKATFWKYRKHSH